MQARHAKTRGYRYIVAAKCKLLCFDLFAKAFDCQTDAVLVGMGYDEQEFVAADAPADVAQPGIDLEDFRKFLQDNIPGVVPVRIAEGFCSQTGKTDSLASDSAIQLDVFSRFGLFSSLSFRSYSVRVGCDGTPSNARRSACETNTGLADGRQRPALD